MSMNRMFLRCKKCGKKFMLAKCSCCYFFNPFDPIQYQKDFDAFMEEHHECCGRECEGYGLDLELIYECDWMLSPDCNVTTEVDERRSSNDSKPVEEQA